MGKKQLFFLFLCSLVPWTIGNGMMSLLPVYMGQLGASQAMAGYLLSLLYVALAAGTVTAGYLSDKLQRRKLLVIICGTVSVPALWLMGRATSVGALAATLVAWNFTAGVGVAQISILAGLFAGKAERGKVFGILSLSFAVGALIGGLAAGPIVDHWGYPALFSILSLVSVLWPAAGLFLQEKEGTGPEPGAEAVAAPSSGLGRGFYLLFTAAIAAAVGMLVFYVGRTLMMDDLGFPAAAITRAVAIGGAVSLPLPFLVGCLSDRVGRKPFLVLGYLAVTFSLMALSVSTSLWHFWAASFLGSLSGIGGAVGTAFVTDLVPKGSLGRALSLFGASTWIAAIIGCAGTGYAMQTLGPLPTCLVGATLPLVAMALLIPISLSKQTDGAPTSHLQETPAVRSLRATA